MPNVTLKFTTNEWDGFSDVLFDLAYAKLPQLIGDILGEEPRHVVVDLVRVATHHRVVINGADLDVNIQYGGNAALHARGRLDISRRVSDGVAEFLASLERESFTLDVQVQHLPCSGVSNVVRGEAREETGTW